MHTFFDDGVFPKSENWYISHEKTGYGLEFAS